MVNGPPCAVCGTALRREAQGWWCDRCQTLATAEPARPHTASQPPRFAQTMLGQTRPPGLEALATAARAAATHDDTSAPHAGATMTGGFAPVATAPPATPTPALPAEPQLASRYAPGGGEAVPSPYAGPREASQPYSPIPLVRPAAVAAAPPTPSRKGWAIALAIAAASLIGVVIAVVALGGGDDRSARDALVVRTFAALGDEDALTALLDAETVLDRFVDCSPDAKRDADGDADDEVLGGSDRDDESRGARARARHLERTAREIRRASAMVDGARVEVLAILTPPPPAGAFASGDNAGDRSGAAAPEDPGIVRHPVGKRVFGGCYSKVNHTIQLVRVKVRVAPKEREPFEDRASLAMLQLDNDQWFVISPPRIYAGTSAVVAKARVLRDRMCDCQDLACLEHVDRDFDAWRSDPLTHDLPDDEAAGLDAVRDDYRTCQRAVETVHRRERGPRAVQQMTALKDAMCKCRDAACADRVKRSAKVPDSFGLDADARKQVTSLRDAYYACSIDASVGAPVPAYDPDMRIEPDIAPACEDYARAMQKLAACSTYPEDARRDLKQSFKTMMNLWRGYSGMQPALQRATVDTCIRGRVSTQESMTKFGCS